MSKETILSELPPVETSSPRELFPREKYLPSVRSRILSRTEYWLRRITGMSALTDLELRKALATFRKTHRERTPLEELLPSWRILRKSLSVEQFRHGCRLYLENGPPLHPKPSDIKRLALEERSYVSPDFWTEAEYGERPPFDRAAFRENLRQLAGIDLDGPRPITPKREYKT